MCRDGNFYIWRGKHIICKRMMFVICWWEIKEIIRGWGGQLPTLAYVWPCHHYVYNKLISLIFGLPLHKFGYICIRVLPSTHKWIDSAFLLQLLMRLELECIIGSRESEAENHNQVAHCPRVGEPASEDAVVMVLSSRSSIILPLIDGRRLPCELPKDWEDEKDTRRWVL